MVTEMKPLVITQNQLEVETVLWENPNPSSDFASGTNVTVTLNQSFADFDVLRVYFKDNKTDARYNRVIDFENPSMLDTAGNVRFIFGGNVGGRYLLQPNADKTTLGISQCFEFYHANTYPARFIPIKLVGVNKGKIKANNDKNIYIKMFTQPASSAINANIDGKAHAIFYLDTDTYLFTNVNPNTYEISDTKMWYCRLSTLSSWTEDTGHYFIRTNGNISTNSAMRTNQYNVCLFYTLE